MKTEAEIRMAGMQALLGSLGLVAAERFMVAQRPTSHVAGRSGAGGKYCGG